ncbi:MAG: tRNA adenosine(34) deaminase TadA [Acidobacteria bacterium]|nr:tRNA adenosine(34) deaminase TadA [Acidobacteriota bacterium]
MDDSSSLNLEHDADAAWMREALDEAAAAAADGEVPIGAVVVLNSTVIARGRNRTIRDCDPTAHAEIVAIRMAAAAAGNYRLTGATMYATVEPCAMCAGALVWSRISRLVYAAPDVRAGAVRSVFEICTSDTLNHRLEVRAGVLEDDSRELMQAFFRERRVRSRSDAEG